MSKISLEIIQNRIDLVLEGAAGETVLEIAARPEVLLLTASEQGIRGRDGRDGYHFTPSRETRFTQFIGDGLAETNISDARIALPLVPIVSRTVERGLANWWNAAASRITPETALDAFRFRLTILARPVEPATVPVLIVELSNSAEGSTPIRVIAVEKQPITSGAFEEMSFNFEAFAGANLIANGGRVTLRAVGGNIVVKDPRLLIKEG